MVRVDHVFPSAELARCKQFLKSMVNLDMQTTFLATPSSLLVHSERRYMTQLTQLTGA